MSAPLPWRPPVATAFEGALAAWVDGVRWPADGPLGRLGWGGATVDDGAALAARIDEPSAVALPVRLVGAAAGGALVVVPWRLVRALVQAVLGAVDELAAPRPPTAVERAVVAGVVAEVLAGAGLVAEVGLARPVAPAAPAGVVRLVASRPVAAELAIVVPAAPPPRRRELTALVADRGARLPRVAARVELARGALPAGAADRLARLARGDVVLVGPAAGALAAGRGRLTGALDLAAGTLTVADYQRMTSREQLADDLSIPVAVVAGEVTLSARALLELAPGAVLPLGRPLAGAVELWAGGRRLGRGELVEIDGALGVRVAELADAPSTPDHDDVLVRATPASDSWPSVPR